MGKIEGLGLKVGDIVEVSAPVKGKITKKTCRVIEVLPLFQRPDPRLAPELYMKNRECGRGRNHESYVVINDETHKVYWPKNKNIKKI